MNISEIHILLVEDNEGDVVLTLEALKEAKLTNRISVVRDGEEALSFLYKQGKYADAEAPQLILLDINLPDIDPDEVQGVRVTRLARRVYTDSITRSQDPSGREYFWIGGGGVEWQADEGTDFHAVQAGYISVTPLHLDLTNYRLLSAVSEWGLHP